MRKLWTTSVLLLTFSAGMWAQESSSSSQTQAIQELLQRVTALEKKVQDLEQQNQQLKSEAAATAGSAVQVAPVRPPEAAQTVTPPSPSPPSPMETMAEQSIVHETYPNLKIRGFANVDYTAADSPSQPTGFTMGQFVMHFTSALSKKVSFFGELSFTATQTNYNANVERAIVRYDANDYFKVSFGRYHTPVNYWNTAFHHGAWLQTTITRPEMIKFGGRFLPVHFVGALAEGQIPSGSLGLNYNFGVGNGRETIPLLSYDGDSGDVNSNRAVVAEIFARPEKLYGLQIGGSVYQDKISPDPVAGNSFNQFKEWIYAGHLAYEKESPEVLVEFANVHHRNYFTGQTWDSQGAYAQFAYRLPGIAHKFKPYYRYEYIHVPPGEPVLMVPELKAGHTAGARYDITDFAAFKVEYRNWNRTSTDKFQGFYAQTAFTF